MIQSPEPFAPFHPEPTDPRDAPSERKAKKALTRTFKHWKDGRRVDCTLKTCNAFRPASTTEAIGRDRVFAVDTESLKTANPDKPGTFDLKTLLVPCHFPSRSVTLETPEGSGMLHSLFAAIFEEGYAEDEEKPSYSKQRDVRPRQDRTPCRDGRRQTIEPCVAVWFNLPYDFGRLADDMPGALRAVASGADSYRVQVSERFELEVARMTFGSSSSFEWFVRDKNAKTIARVLGIDLVGYWKCSLAKAAEAVHAPAKIDIEAILGPRVYETPREAFSEDDWNAFRDYAARDAETTLALYHATVDLLQTIDARVIRKTGLIPQSAPGAASRIVFAQAFDLHPELKEWKRYPAWADQMGCDAYFGGRSFCAKPGLYTNMMELDLSGAYAFQQTVLPDPVTVDMQLVKPSKCFDVDDWIGKYGVLYISGEGLDDVYPAFRTHDDERGGRLRYVAGKFTNLAVTIPEIVIGVLRGALRVDRIHKGVALHGSAEKSFLREGVLKFNRIKEDPRAPEALQKMAKLLSCANYGKLVEINRKTYMVGDLFPTPNFTRKERVCASLALVYAENGASSEALGERVYWGEDVDQIAKAKKFYDFFRGDVKDQNLNPPVASYVRALECAGCPHDKEAKAVSIRDYVAEFSEYKCGQFFFPLYAAQITGSTSAMLGLMAHSLGALQGDTDSAHVVLPEGIASAYDLPGYARYFEIMKRAGYPAPQAGELGGWKQTTQTPSTESVLVRPKVYSHRFEEKDGAVFKQAKHGFSKFHSKEIELVLKRECKTVEEKTARDNDVRIARGLGLAKAMKTLLAGLPFEYDTRPAPRKIREAVRSGLPVGVFIPKHMRLLCAPDPNTWTDTEGIVHWNHGKTPFPSELETRLDRMRYDDLKARKLALQ